MYSDKYKYEYVTINNKAYKMNYVITALRKVYNIADDFAHYKIVHCYTDDEILDVIHRYQSGERYARQNWHCS